MVSGNIFSITLSSTDLRSLFYYFYNIVIFFLLEIFEMLLLLNLFSFNYYTTDSQGIINFESFFFLIALILIILCQLFFRTVSMPSLRKQMTWSTKVTSMLTQLDQRKMVCLRDIITLQSLLISVNRFWMMLATTSNFFMMSKMS